MAERECYELNCELDKLASVLESLRNQAPQGWQGEAYEGAIDLCKSMREAVGKCDSELLKRKLDALDYYVGDSLPWTDELLESVKRFQAAFRRLRKFIK